MIVSTNHKHKGQRYMKSKIAIFSAIAIATLLGIYISPAASADSGGPTFDGPGMSYDYQTSTLSVHSEDPVNNPLVYEWLVGTFTTNIGCSVKDSSNYYHLNLTCYNWDYELDVSYTGISNSIKQSVLDAANGFNPNHTYTVEDMRLINLIDAGYTHGTYSTYRDFFRYSVDYEKAVKNKNIYISFNALAGDSGTFTTSSSGYGALIYNDYIYKIYNDISIDQRNVIYIPSNTPNTVSDYMQAAKNRLQTYIGDRYNITISDTGGSSSSDWEIKLEDLGEYSGNIANELGVHTGVNHYYKLTYFYGREITIAIAKDDNKLSYNFYNMADLKTDASLQLDGYSGGFHQSTLKISKYSSTDRQEIVERTGLNGASLYHIGSLNQWKIDIGLGHYNSNVKYFTVKFPIPAILKGKTISMYYASDSVITQISTAVISGDYVLATIPVTTDFIGDYIIGTTEQVNDGPTQPDDPIIPDPDPTPTVVDVTEGFYTIRSFVNSNYVFDIAGGSNQNGANVQLYTSNDSVAQKFAIKKNSDNTYTIENLASGKVLDVAGGGTQNGTNVWQHAANGTCAQKWTFLKNADDSYTIKSSCSGKVLDIAGGSIRNNGNVQIYESNGTIAQKFTLDLIQDFPKEQVVSDGIYKIVAASNNTYGLTVANNYLYAGANVQLGRSSQKESQFAIRHVGNGFYRVANINSLRALDVAGGNGFIGANIQQYDWNGTKAQLWTFKKNSDNSYTIMSRTNLLCMDASGGNIANNVNIQLWSCNNTIAQKFNLIAQ